MRYVSHGRILLFMALGASFLWGQGTGRRGTTAPTTATPATTPANDATANPGRGGGRGGAAAGATGSEFFDFDPTASQTRLGPNVDGAPAETHQKITVNGQPLAYTAHAGFLPLVERDHRSRGSASILHVLFKGRRQRRFHAPDHVLLRRRSGRLGRLAGIRRSRSETHEAGRRLDGEPRYHPEPGRSGIRQSRGHRLQLPRSAQPRADLLEYRRRHRVARRVCAHLSGPQQPRCLRRSLWPAKTRPPGAWPAWQNTSPST